MAKETKEERRERIQKEVAERSAARKEAYFETQAEAKAGAAAIAPDLPAADAYKYSYVWRQDPGSPTGEQVLIKTINPYYDPATDTILDPATGERRPATQSMFSGPSRIRANGTVVTNPNAKDPKTGLTLAQQEAADALAKAKGVNSTLAAQLGAKIDPATGKIIKSTIDPVKAAAWYSSQNPNVSSNANTGNKTVKSRVTNSDGSITITYTDGTTETIGASSKNDSGYTGNVVSGATGPTLAKDIFKSTLALYFGQGELAKGWMDELYNAVSKFYLNGADVSTAFNMALLDSRNNPNLKAFTDRFKGIYALQDLRQAGKPVTVPTIAEYVAAQAGMADTLNQVGLGDLATEQFTGDLIGKGNSVTTVAEKIAKVFQRIDMAPKAIKDTLSRYFPTVDRTTLARTLLTGQKGVDQLVDELEQYDVLAAAEQQGIGALGAMGKVGGVTEERAQEYARLGETFGSILPKFGRVAQATPVVSKLAGISGVADIGQAGVEKAVIMQSAKELSNLQTLSEQEEARFAGKAGRAELGLASQRRAQRAF